MLTKTCVDATNTSLRDKHQRGTSLVDPTSSRRAFAHIICHVAVASRRRAMSAWIARSLGARTPSGRFASPAAMAGTGATLALLPAPFLW
jgi:hypothetical protein